MSISAINFTKEMIRQGINQDFNFFQKMTYYFELNFPSIAAGGVVAPGTSNSFMFPLVIPPESYSLEEPFAVELTPTQRGGLYAEENGIIQRSIKLRGTTGFKPRMLKTYGSMLSPSSPPVPMSTSPIALANMEPSAKSYSRSLPITLFAEVSGHRHFQYLQDSVFRTYADLKRDPVTCKDVTMFFHNPKDDEHWKVIPLRFTLDRDKSKPTLYNYNIELAVVGKANNTFELDFDDKNILDILNDALYMAALAEDLMAGTLNDLIAIQDDLGTVLSNITVLLDGLTDVLNATSEFVAGNEQFVNVPYTYVNSLTEFFDAAAKLTGESEETEKIPPTVTQMLRKASEGLEFLAVNPAIFITPNDATMRAIRNKQELRRSLTTTQQNEILAGTSPTSFAELNALGTTPTPGEVVIGGGDILAGGEIKRFKSMRMVEIGQNDTLVSLAAQYLGDARLWQYLAIVNGLKPPYVDDLASIPLSKGRSDESPFGQSLGRGSKIIIPSNTTTPKDYPISPVLGTRLEESVENQVLGIDVLLEPDTGIVGDSTALYDIAINTELGSTDVKLVEGVSNMVQVVTNRLITEQGSDLLYKQVGIKRIIGLNFALADLANARYRIRESVEADPRITSIRNLQFEQQDDALQATMDAVLRGFTESRPLQVMLR